MEQATRLCEENKRRELLKAKSELDYYRRIGGLGYKQAKAHYERVVRKWKKDTYLTNGKHF